MDDRWCILGGVRLVCGLFLFLSVTSVPANEPGAAALDFLEKLRAGELDTEPGGDTALATQYCAGQAGIDPESSGAAGAGFAWGHLRTG